MSILSIISGVVSLLNYLVGWAHDRQIITAAQKEAAYEGTKLVMAAMREDIAARDNVPMDDDSVRNDPANIGKHSK